MPYLTIAQASTASGKSEKTIRRLANRPESKPYISKEGTGHNSPILIDANYLQNVYPLSIPGQPTQSPQDTSGQRLDTPTQSPIDTNTVELRHTIELLKQELRHKEELYSRVTLEKDKRIEVLERSLLLLGEGQRKEADPEQPGAEEEPQPEQRRKWWKLF
jgi:hypothetical protein